MEMDSATTLEESIRKLRGVRYILSELAYADDREPDEVAMLELLASTLDGITGDLKVVLDQM